MKQLASLSSNVIIVENQVNNKKSKYQKINSYTHKPSIEQILAISIFILNLAIHCVFVIKPIFAIDHPIMYFMWAIFIILLLLIIFLYFYITCMDPVDQLLLFPEEIPKWVTKQNEYALKHVQNKKKSRKKEVLTTQNPFELKQCKSCEAIVKFNSYHCWTCRHCVQNMDHHCKFLNNCIGGKNYFSFFCLVLCVIVYLFMGTGIGIWIFIRTFSDQKIQDISINRWAILVYIIFSFIFSIVVQSLCYFHCYISCCLGITTIQYIFRDTDSNYSSKNQIISEDAQLDD